MTELERAMARAERLIFDQRVEEGMFILTDLLFDEPGSALLHNILGWGYLYFVNDAEVAKMHFEAAMRFDPAFAPPYLHMGNMMNKKGLYSQALLWFDRGLLRKDANKLALAEGMAFAYEMRGEYRMAIRRYKEALSLSTDFEFSGLRKSISRCRSKRWILFLNKAVRQEGFANQVLFLFLRGLGWVLAWNLVRQF